MASELCEWFDVPWLEVEAATRRYLRKWVADEDDLNDMTQDCLVKVWTRGATYSGRSAWSSWVYRIARNTFLSRHRSKHRAVPLEASPVSANPEDRLLADVTVARLLAGLPSREREVLVLALAWGMTSAEIGRRLGIADSTVRCRQMRARATLAELRVGAGLTPGS